MNVLTLVMFQADQQFESGSSPLQFSHNYQELVAGVNRIRYLKKKQMHNHQMMTHHLNNLLTRYQRQQQLEMHKTQTQKTQFKLPSEKSHTLQTKFKYSLPSQCPYRPKPLRQGTCRLSQDQKENKDEDKSLQHKGTQASLGDLSSLRLARPPTKGQKLRLLLQEKQQNYQQMRQTRFQLEQKQQQQKLAQLTQARSHKLRIDLERQEGRHRIEHQYFRHLEAIKAVKVAEKSEKIRLNEKRYLQMLQVRHKEEEELALYQKSILAQEELKSFIEQVGCEGDLAKEAVLTNDDTTLL